MQSSSFAALEAIEQDVLQNEPLKSPTYCSPIHNEIHNKSINYSIYNSNSNLDDTNV